MASFSPPENEGRNRDKKLSAYASKQSFLIKFIRMDEHSLFWGENYGIRNERQNNKNDKY
jgi:hypothetical protein